jgi:hypothetical protein
MTEFEKDFMENKVKYIFELVKSMNVSGEEYYANIVQYAEVQYSKMKELIEDRMEF